MAKKKFDESRYVKKETFWLVSLLALAVGFFGGVVFGIYQSDVEIPGQAPVRQASDSGRAGMIVSLEKEVQQNPNNAEAWTQLGNEYFDSNQFDKAIAAYQKSLELKPNNANVLTDMGVMYRRSGRPKQAIEAFDKAVAADPKHEVSRFNKGIVLMHDLNDPQGAIRAWEDLINVNPFAMAPNGQSVDQLVSQLKKQSSQAPAN